MDLVIKGLVYPKLKKLLTDSHLRLWFSLLVFVVVAVVLFKAGESLCEKTVVLGMSL